MPETLAKILLSLIPILAEHLIELLSGFLPNEHEPAPPRRGRPPKAPVPVPISPTKEP